MRNALQDVLIPSKQFMNYYIFLFQACSTKKRKRVGIIPVQATAKSRRMFKLRGSRSAIQGRPRKEQRLAVQLTVGEDDDSDGGVVRHKLPHKKQRAAPGAGHSLMESVSANRRASKKH